MKEVELFNEGNDREISLAAQDAAQLLKQKVSE
jgi:uncharacterized protein YabE (DUF348 family)